MDKVNWSILIRGSGPIESIDSVECVLKETTSALQATGHSVSEASMSHGGGWSLAQTAVGNDETPTPISPIHEAGQLMAQ